MKLIKKIPWFIQVFGISEDKETEEEIPDIATIVTEGSTITGEIVGNDSIHIDGSIRGDIKVNNIVIIGRTGKVLGDIRAKKVICNGICHGNIKADSVEIMEDGIWDGDVHANKVLVKGKFSGNVVCGGFFVDEGGEAKVSAHVKKAVIAGTIDGNLACKELKTLPTSLLRGQIFAEEIYNEGGRIECYIGRYSDLAKNNERAKEYLQIFNTIDGYVLLEAKDYYTDVEEELEKNKPIKKNGEVRKIKGSTNDNDDDSIDVDIEK
ncbi:MAG: hypothetical protein GXO61_04895 [Epsilonproteobacteria bacterium]|nr:hypothetical protein [Campylobacterota bacterium]